MKCKCWFASIDSKWNRELMLLHRCHLPAAQLQCNATPLPSNPGSPLERVIINISIVILWRNSHFASGRTTNKKLRFSWRWKAGPDQGGKPEVPDLQTSLPPPFSCSIAQHTGLYKAYDWPSMNCSVYSQLCWTNLDTGGMCHRLCRQVKYPVLNCRVQLKVFEEKITKPLPTFPNFIACGYFVTRKV